MIWLIAGMVVFLGIHSVRIVAPGFRDRMVAERGEGAWKGIYSVISLIGFVLLIWGYAQARAEAPILYVPPVWTRHIALLLVPIAFVVFVASQLPAGHIKKTLKHPMLVAVKIWALAHLLANGDLASLILFLGFLAWAVVDRISVKRRAPVEFGAVSARNDAIAVVVGLALSAWFIVQLHEWLFGVAPLA